MRAPMFIVLPLLLTAALAAPGQTLWTVRHPNANRVVSAQGERVLASAGDEGAAVELSPSKPPRAVKVAGKLWFPTVTTSGQSLAVQLDFDRCRVAVWDLAAGRAEAVLRGDFKPVLLCGQETEFVFSAAFTPDGRFLLTQDGTALRRWDARTGRLLNALPGDFFNLTLSPDGEWVAAVRQGRRVEVWTSDLSRRLKALPPQPAGCLNGPLIPTEAVWNVGSTRLAFSCDREVRVWNVAGGGLTLLPRAAKREYPDSPSFSPDGQYVAANEGEAGVAVWRTDNASRIAQTRPLTAEGQATDLQIAPDNTLYAAFDTGQVVVQRLGRSERPAVWNVFPGAQPGSWLTLALGRDRLAMGDGSGRVKVVGLR